MCITPGAVSTAVSTTGDFAQTNNCPSTLFTFNYPSTSSCTINVTFTPTTAGSRAGTLSAGGMNRPLSGTGVALPIQPTGQHAAAIKKCKRKFPGMAKAKKRKKCIKEAKKLPV